MECCIKCNITYMTLFLYMKMDYIKYMLIHFSDDVNRVILLDGGSDYMNASYIDVS